MIVIQNLFSFAEPSVSESQQMKSEPNRTSFFTTQETGFTL